jgi:hypothetical protein
MLQLVAMNCGAGDSQLPFPIRDARLIRVARPRWDAITVARTESKNPSSHVPRGTCVLDRHTGAR